MAKPVEPYKWNPLDLPNEVWVIAPGFTNYKVSNLGRIKRLAGVPPSTKKECLLTPTNANATLRLNRQIIYVPLAALILEAFIGPKPTPIHVARHLDDNRDNNLLSNLAWGTPKENAQDAIRNNRLPDQYGKIISIAQRKKAKISQLRYLKNNPEHLHKHSKKLKVWWTENNLIWITNGIQEKRIRQTEKIPLNWYKGRNKLQRVIS